MKEGEGSYRWDGLLAHVYIFSLSDIYNCILNLTLIISRAAALDKALIFSYRDSWIPCAPIKAVLLCFMNQHFIRHFFSIVKWRVQAWRKGGYESLQKKKGLCMSYNWFKAQNRCVLVNVFSRTLQKWDRFILWGAVLSRWHLLWQDENGNRRKQCIFHNSSVCVLISIFCFWISNRESLQ